MWIFQAFNNMQFCGFNVSIFAFVRLLIFQKYLITSPRLCFILFFIDLKQKIIIYYLYTFDFISLLFIISEYRYYQHKF